MQWYAIELDTGEVALFKCEPQCLGRLAAGLGTKWEMLHAYGKAAGVQVLGPNHCSDIDLTGSVADSVDYIRANGTRKTRF